jgi:hypothetical protein
MEDLRYVVSPGVMRQLEDAEVADLLRKIGWRAEKSDIAEIEKHQATRERAKLVYDSSNRSAFEAAVEAYHARVTAATLELLAHQLLKRSDQLGDLSFRRSGGPPEAVLMIRRVEAGRRSARQPRSL